MESDIQSIRKCDTEEFNIIADSGSHEISLKLKLSEYIKVLLCKSYKYNPM